MNNEAVNRRSFLEQGGALAGGYRVTDRKSFPSILEASDYIFLMLHPEDEPHPLVTL